MNKKKGSSDITSPSASSTSSPIVSALLQLDSILQAESKRREESNQLLNTYIEEYFEDLDNQIYNDFVKMEMATASSK